ncbi:MAG: hypothetical protein BWK72_03415 [Rhodoferax ferrireducens]|uniref:Uncharacterized protein n=1 Tax=Rhodoferax ferrireducens TaxID=192843 RepID=A0A1W9KWK6_9BURK|nr:MAG: hypothetical protein BWK72_03415 [Rhodoferax ferrireducens]
MSTEPGACERLAQSRERLRQVLGHGGTGPAAGSTVSAAGSSPWLASATSAPEASILLDLLQSWWRKQPLQLVLTLAAQATTTALQPTAQRHPYRLVLGAALFGGVLTLMRPWRWVSSTTVLATLLPRILSEVSKHLPAQLPGTATPGHDPAP